MNRCEFSGKSLSLYIIYAYESSGRGQEYLSAPVRPSLITTTTSFPYNLRFVPHGHCLAVTMSFVAANLNECSNRSGGDGVAFSSEKAPSAPVTHLLGF